MVTETRYRATSISARHLYRRAHRAGQGRTGVRPLVRDLEQELEPPTLALYVELGGAGLARVAKETLALAKPFRPTLDGPLHRVGAVLATGHVPRDGLVVVDDPEVVCHFPDPSETRISLAIRVQRATSASSGLERPRGPSLSWLVWLPASRGTPGRDAGQRHRAISAPEARAGITRIARCGPTCGTDSGGDRMHGPGTDGVRISDQERRYRR